MEKNNVYFKFAFLVFLIMCCGAFSVIGGYLFMFQESHNKQINEILIKQEVQEYRDRRLQDTLNKMRENETKRTIMWTSYTIKSSKTLSELMQVEGNIKVYEENIKDRIYDKDFYKEVEIVIKDYKDKMRSFSNNK